MGEEGGLPEVAPDGVSHFEEEDAGRVDETQAADDGDVLGEDVFGVGAGVQETFTVSVKGRISR